MAIHPISHMTRTQHIVSVLRKEISAGRWKTGECLEPIKLLAKRFETSIAPVHQALVLLEEEGLVIRRVGAGTFVTGRQPVGNPMQTAFFINASGHIFSEFTAMVLGHLHQASVYPVMIDGNHESARHMIRPAVEAARLIIMNGNQHFPFSVLEGVSLRNKQLIGLFEWANPALESQVHRVLIDFALGGRMVADYLYGKRHKRVLMVGTSTMLDANNGEVNSLPARGFSGRWQELGGELFLQNSLSNPGSLETQVNPDRLLEILRGPNAPTAVFGLRDFEAWQVQDILFRNDMELYHKIEIVGWGNTPWAQAARPRFATVDWNLPAVAEGVFCITDAIFRGEDPGKCSCLLVPPLLVPA